MDEKVFALTPFKDLAEGLAARGIASIRYDKRTYVYGKKMTKELITAKEETIDDAILATELLRANPAVDPDRVFIVGHSMGAMLAPRIDAEGGNYRGLVMMAGTPYRIEEIMVRQFKQVGASKGILMKFVAKRVKRTSRFWRMWITPSSRNSFLTDLTHDSNYMRALITPLCHAFMMTFQKQQRSTR